MIVSPPRIIGTHSVARLLGVKQDSAWRLVDRKSPTVAPGYLGKIGGRHCWNAPVLINSLFGSDVELEAVLDTLTCPDPVDPLDRMLCGVPGCDALESSVGLCRHHMRMLNHAWRHAPRSSLVMVQLVAMCRWVAERNSHLVLPADFDPWSQVCMTPGCEAPTNDGSWHGPLCQACAGVFWGNAPRPYPSYWKQSRGGRDADEEAQARGARGVA